MFERFTDDARDVIVCAQGEARSLGHDHIGTEHLLLGLLRVETGVAARALQGVNVTLDGVRSEVERETPAIDGPTTAQIPFTPRAKKTLELALREALSVRSAEVDTEHLLLGLVRENGGPAMDILRRAGVEGQSLRERIQRTPNLAESTRWIELTDGVRDAVSKAIEAVARAGRVAQDADDKRRAGIVGEAERLLRRLLD